MQDLYSRLPMPSSRLSAPHFPFSLTKDEKNTHLTFLTYPPLNYGKDYTYLYIGHLVSILGDEYFITFYRGGGGEGEGDCKLMKEEQCPMF